MGKGSNPRKFTKKGHHQVLKNWDEPYPERKVNRPGKTTYVWRGGKLVDKDADKENFISMPQVDYSEYDRIVKRFERKMLEKMLEQYGAPKEALGMP
jgi:hypothetical protein